MENKRQHIDTNNGIKINLIAKKIVKQRDHRTLGNRAACGVKHAFKRMNPVDSDRRHRFSCMVNFVDWPQDRPFVHPSVHQVFRKIINHKHRHRKQSDDDGL